MKKKVSEATINRLAIYMRHLRELKQSQVDTISSQGIAQAVNVDAAIVRKDLGYFGEFGTRGVGYSVAELYAQLQHILGMEEKIPVVLLGAGRLGSALALYPGFENWGLEIAAIFDIDPQVLGSNWGKVTVRHISELEEVFAQQPIEMAILAVPSEVSQELADQLVGLGVRAILNFSPRILKIPEHVTLRNFDMSVYLAVLSYHLQD